MHLLSIYKSGAVCICAPSSVCVNKLNNQSCLTPEIEKKTKQTKIIAKSF